MSKLITRNRALKSSLTAIIKREAPDRYDLETLIAAFYGRRTRLVRLQCPCLASGATRRRHATGTASIRSPRRPPTSARPAGRRDAIARAHAVTAVQRRLPRRERLRPERR